MSGQIVQNEWQFGLCECCSNPGICCKAMCCPLCLMCDTAEAMGKDSCLWCLIACCFPVVATAVFRSDAREKFGIEGSAGEDWVCSCCCNSLINCQTAAEIKVRAEAAGK